jgi:thiol-disulfide isomerase/thioredoxin
MRSTVSGVAVGLLVAAILVAVALTVLPDLVPGAGSIPSSTPRDISSSSARPGESPASSLPGGTPAPDGSLDPGASGSPAPSSAPSSAPDIGLAVGQQAPALIVDRLGGGTLDLSTFRGSPVWLNFMATWCPSCSDEIPQMMKYQAQLGDRGLVVVLVDVREDADTVEPFVQSFELDSPVGLDLAGRAQRAWGAFALPIHYFIDADGIVRSVMYGELSPPQFEEGLTRIIPGLSFEPSPTPSQPAGSGEPPGSSAPAASEEPAASASAAP